MKKTLAAIAATGLLSAGLIAGTATAANATISDCSSTYFCGWFDLTYTGAGPYANAGNVYYVGLIPNDQFTSVYNHGVSSNIIAYADWYWTGPSIFVGRGSAIADLRNYSFNDMISSYEWV